MGTFAIGALLIVAATMIGLVLFVIWLIYVVLLGGKKAVGFVLGSIFHLPRQRNKFMLCTRLRCGEQNPVQARFCRRCGVTLANAPAQARADVVLQRG